MTDSFFDFSAEHMNLANAAMNSYCDQFGPSPKTSAFPYFCKTALREKLIWLSKNIHRTLNEVTNDFFDDQQKYPRVVLPSEYRSLVQKNKLYDDQCPVIRVDCFIGENQDDIQILEFNCAEPSAYSWNDLMVQGLKSSSTFKRLQDSTQSELRSDLLLPGYLSMAERYYAASMHKKITEPSPKTVHLYMPENSTVYFDFKCLRHFLANTYGYRVTLNDPTLFVDDHNAIHIRDSIDDLNTKNPLGNATELAKQIELQSCFILNPASSTVGDQKSLLPYLKGKLPIIDSHHVHITSGSDNLTSLKLEKDSFVLKPSQGYGGYGIIIGKHENQDRWNAKIDQILSGANNYIAQRYVSPDIHVDFFGRKTMANFNFWIFGGQFAGAFVRTSSKEPINYHQGGALLPVVYC